MKTLKLASVIVFLIIFYNNTIAQQLSKQQINNINSLIEDLDKNDEFSGTILIAKGNKIIFEKAVGMSNKELKTKNNLDTKFCIGSINKMFTAVAIAQLVEKNLLKYEDKVTKYLPQLPVKVFGEITIEQLLTHTSGTGDFFLFPKFESIADTAKTITTYVNIGIDEPLLFKPASKVKYSNYGFVLLGGIIESVSKMNYYDYVKQNIFVKANMINTDFYERDKVHENLAIGYMLPPEVLQQLNHSKAQKVERVDNTRELEVKGNSAGGGYSTVKDLYKFSLALINEKLVSKKTLEIITKGKVLLLPAIKERNLPEVKYGYGFGEIFRNNKRMFGHTGGAPGVDAQVEIYPDLGYTVVALSNYDRGTMHIMKLIQDSLTGS